MHATVIITMRPLRRADAYLSSLATSSMPSEQKERTNYSR
jgi:hypothetical protein